MSIKIVEGLEPWQVMKAASEGKQWAARGIEDNQWIRMHGRACAIVACLAAGQRVAIIDDTMPEIDWSEFDWEFFKQYGGVIIEEPDDVRVAQRQYTLNSAPLPQYQDNLAESPLYPWTGGKCPAPGNVEVNAVYRDGTEVIARAGGIHWGRLVALDSCEEVPHSRDVIAFRITGNVCK